MPRPDSSLCRRTTSGSSFPTPRPPSTRTTPTRPRRTWPASVLAAPQDESSIFPQNP
nr:unnamed protein product [Digitaria exilis]